MAFFTKYNPLTYTGPGQYGKAQEIGNDPNLTDERAGELLGIPFFGKQKFGYYQYLKGLKKAEGLEKPTYEIPEEIKQNLTQAQLRAIQGLPEAQQRAYIENIQRSTGASLANLTNLKAGLKGVGSAAQTEADAYRNLLGMDVQAREANQDKLMAARAIMGDQKALQWQINKMQPYLQSYGESQKLIGAGSQNVMSATQANEKYFMDLLGQGAEIGATAAGAGG